MTNHPDPDKVDDARFGATNTIVTEAFLTAAIELAEGLRMLSRTENADDISQIPRMYWERWDGAADVILGRLK